MSGDKLIRKFSLAKSQSNDNNLNQNKNYSEREILIQLFEKAANAVHPWNNSKYWCTNEYISHWHGVKVSDYDKVIELNLSSNNLKGSLPSSIGYLAQLQILDLSKNDLIDKIPDSLGLLKRLTLLNLSFNQFSGLIPDFSESFNLTSLDLSYNNITGFFPDCICNLPLITNLNISNNQLIGNISDLSCLTKLSTLDISSNYFSGPFPDSICEITRLTKINISRNQIDGVIPFNFDNLVELKELDFSSNKLSGPIPDVLCNLTKLTDINLCYNQLSGDLPENIGNITCLLRINLSENVLTGYIPDSIGTLKNLIYLNISHNQLTGYIPDSLSQCVNIEHIFLSNNHLSGPMKDFIGDLTKLISLGLCSNQFTGIIPDCFYKLDKLVYLSIHSNFFIGTYPLSFQELNLDVFTVLSYRTRRAVIVNMIKPELDNVILQPLKFNTLQKPISINPTVSSSHILTEFLYIYKKNKYCICFLDEDFISNGENLLDLLKINNRSPIQVYNLIKFDYYDRLYEICCHPVKSYSILYRLIQFWRMLVKAQKKQIITTEDITISINLVENMIVKIFNCDSLDDPIKSTRLFLEHSESINDYYNIMNNEYMKKSILMKSTSSLGICTFCELKTIFATYQASMILDYLFWECSKEYQGIYSYFRVYNSLKAVIADYYDETYPIYKLIYRVVRCLLFIEKNDDYPYYSLITDLNLHSKSWGRWLLVICDSPRNCPAVMFYLEGISKVIMLYLIGQVAINDYNNQYNITHIPIYTKAEIWLMIFMVSSWAYEFGQLLDYDNWKRIHIKQINRFWNILDYIDLLLILLWFILKNRFYRFAKLMISMAAIPMSIGILQYFSMMKDLGELIIILGAMVNDLIVFLVVYMFSILGFGMCFYALYQNSEYFASPGQTFLTLLSAALANPSFSVFVGGEMYESFGLTIFVIFIAITAIVLLNLLIARMSISHQRINVSSLKEWSYVKARIVKEYMYTQKFNSFRNLPPPLNLITIAISAIRYMTSSLKAYVYKGNKSEIFKIQANTSNVTIIPSGKFASNILRLIAFLLLFISALIFTVLIYLPIYAIAKIFIIFNKLIGFEFIVSSELSETNLFQSNSLLRSYNSTISRAHTLSFNNQNPLLDDKSLSTNKYNNKSLNILTDNSIYPYDEKDNQLDNQISTKNNSSSNALHHKSYKNIYKMITKQVPNSPQHKLNKITSNSPNVNQKILNNQTNKLANSKKDMSDNNMKDLLFTDNDIRYIFDGCPKKIDERVNNFNEMNQRIKSYQNEIHYDLTNQLTNIKTQLRDILNEVKL